MLRPRVIPVLLLENEKLVKTKQFSNPSYVGDPINVVKIFNEKECDELILIDISISKNQIEPNYRHLEDIASECFMPMTYGGGIRTIEQATKIFKLGFEKICINNALYQNSRLIKDLVNKFGSQSIVASLDIRYDSKGLPKPFDYLRKKFFHDSLDKTIEYINNLEIGELLLNFVDKDGMMDGPDLETIDYISSQLDIPLVAIGGIASSNDIVSVLQTHASAAAAGSLFVYFGPHKAVLISYLEKDQFVELIDKVNP